MTYKTIKALQKVASRLNKVAEASKPVDPKTAVDAQDKVPVWTTIPVKKMFSDSVIKKMINDASPAWSRRSYFDYMASKLGNHKVMGAPLKAYAKSSKATKEEMIPYLRDMQLKRSEMIKKHPELEKLYRAWGENSESDYNLWEAGEKEVYRGRQDIKVDSKRRNRMFDILPYLEAKYGPDAEEIEDELMHLAHNNTTNPTTQIG